MPDDFSKELFKCRIGQRFFVGATPEAIEIELIEVTRLEASEPRPFSVLFRGPRTPLLSQRIHCLAGDGQDALELFLVPIGPDREGQHQLYEAVFN